MRVTTRRALVSHIVAAYVATCIVALGVILWEVSR